MVKLLIADDEPLVCVGLRSMLNWEELGIEVVGTARNGQQAAEMIASLKPEIVITDIKMPLKSGLALAAECADLYGRIPLFIMFTSYEEYELARGAIKVQAVDYLVKLDLTPEILREAVEKALAIIVQLRKSDSTDLKADRISLQAVREKFFLRLYYNLFDTDAQFLTQKDETGIVFNSPAYAAAICEIIQPSKPDGEPDAQNALYASAIQMVQETLSKTFACYVSALDTRHFSITLCLSSDNAARQRELLEQSLSKTAGMVYNYFSLSLRSAVGPPVQNLRYLSESYASARLMFHSDGAAKLQIFQTGVHPVVEGTEFKFSAIRPAIRGAFAELDSASLSDAFAEIIRYFENRPDLRVQAMDAACSILYMAISLLPDGEKNVSGIFDGTEDSYRHIYRLQTTDAILTWLARLRDGCCEILSSQRQNYKQQTVRHVQAYIHENLGKRLSLNDVAAVFNLSPSYLSQLFAKYVGEGFVEHITSERIAEAKRMLARGEGRIYEIADQLGFESAFYFSRVFKKLEGVSPRDYLRRLNNAEGSDEG